MKRALVDRRDGIVAQIAEDGVEFLVAWPFAWVDVPDDAVLRHSVWHEDGTVTNPASSMSDLTQSAVLAAGSMVSTTYVMQAGGGLPEHVHEDKGHTTNVLRGTIAVCRNGVKEIHAAGQQTKFVVGEAHAIIAITNAIIVNIAD